MNLMKGIGITAALCCTLSVSAQQSSVDAVKKYLLEQESVTDQDISELRVTDEYSSKHNGVTHLYGSQALNDIRIANSHFTAVFRKDGQLIHVTTNLVALKGVSVSAGSPTVGANQAILNTASSDIPGLVLESNLNRIVLSNQNGYTHETEIELVYFKTPEDGLRLAWHFNIDMPAQDHWWDYFVDAENNKVLHRVDWQVECSAISHKHNDACNHHLNFEDDVMPPPVLDGTSYRVFDFPIESPNHGGRTLVSEPANDIASPFGWHDNDGEFGADYQITRGNNVFAYEDASDNNQVGYSPDAGSSLSFDYPFNAGDNPESYQEASITNLFFVTNRIHDLLYLYGFDEASGNFQQTNYTNEGQGSDYLHAQAQDGGGMNNANMATPADGNNPRMQMYLWNESGATNSVLDVNEPSNISGSYTVTKSGTFGPDVPESGVTGNVVYAYDGEGDDENDLCTEALNPEELMGNIAIFKRGNCAHAEKVLFAQEAGAIACIFVNYVDVIGALAGVDNPNILIPSTMMRQSEGNMLIEAIENGETVNVTLYPDPDSGIRDGSFDNGVVTHEYVHGLSNRLTGGPSQSGCLWNDEQMGEGWSDWYATMLTMDMSVANPVYRPMGTFANGEAVNGQGIRPAPYDTSFAINSFTYDNVDDLDITIPHGVGFIWATMLWDLTWAFVDEYGFENLETGTTGGNNIVMQLVTDGMKLQPCSPGFVDGRDAILLADQINNEGQNQCLIWKVFARRGLGYSADQGSSQSVLDGESAYDIPTTCQTAVVAPLAGFEASSTYNCDGFVQFIDQSEDVPQAWFWDFGDGETSEEQNPSHVYAGPGLYTVELTVSNTIGENTLTEVNFIEVVSPETPMVEGASGCAGEEVTLTANSINSSIEWRDSQNNVVGTEENLNVILGENSETFTAYGSINILTSEFVGPEDEEIGGGGNHNTSFVGTVDFEVLSPVLIVSVYVNSGGPGIRTINLWDDFSGNGTIIDQKDVNIDFTGGGRIEVGFQIDNPGDYSMGLNFADLYRNENGVEYPYEGSPYLNIVGSSAGTDYYYYFYDFEVVSPACNSDGVDVVAEVIGNAMFTAEADGLVVSFNSESNDAATWTWDFGDGNGSNEENPVHTFPNSGVYSVSLNVDNVCTYTMEVDVVQTGIESFELAGISLMPNPADERIFIQLPSHITDVNSARFFDMSGRLVKTADLSQGGATEIDLSDISNGIYLLILDNSMGSPLYQQKISVAH